MLIPSVYYGGEEVVTLGLFVPSGICSLEQPKEGAGRELDPLSPSLSLLACSCLCFRRGKTMSFQNNRVGRYLWRYLS